MGTEIQAKTYFSRSYSARDQNDSTGGDLWALYPELKTLKNDHYCNSFFTRPAIDVYMGHDKGQLRQTILKHEFIFRHQLEELHRLYKRQRDLMNEIRRRELYQHQIPAEMSQSSLVLSQIPYGVKKTCRVPDSPLMQPTFGRYMSETNSIQSLSFARENNTSGLFLSKDRITPKDCESPESKCNNFQRNMLNLELPASVHMDNKGKQIRESAFGVLGAQSCSLARNCAITHEVNLSIGSGSGCNSDTFRCNIYSSGSRDIVDLNETIEVEEVPISASVDNLGNITCLHEDIESQAVYVNSKSGVHTSLKESSQISLSGKDGRIGLNNMYPEKEGNQSMRIPYKSEAGSTCELDSFHQGVKPLEAEHDKAGKPSSSAPSDINREPRRKRKIFGVEISEGIPDQSVEASHTPSLHPLKPECDTAKSKSSSLSTWSKASSIFGQDVLSIKENPCISSSFTPNGSASSLLQILEIIRGKMQFNNSNSKSASRVEVSCQNGLCFGSQSDAKQLRVCSSSLGYEFPNGTNSNSSIPEQFMFNGSVKYLKHLECMDVKCAKDMNSDAVILQQNPVSSDGQRRHENPMGGLPWLKGKDLAKIQPIKRQEDSYQMNLYSFNYSQQVSDKPEFGNGPYRSSNEDPTSSSMRCCDAKLDRTDAGAFPSNNKIFGFSISVPQTSRDLSSWSSHSNDVAADGTGSNDRKILDQDPSSGVLEVKDLVTEKGLGNYISGLRHCIDLNLCMNEDEAQPVPSLPTAIVKTASTEIDLEAPAVLESEIGPSPEVDSSENRHHSSSELPLDVSQEHSEDPVSAAAEAIVAISSSHLIEDTTCDSLCGLSSDSLHWFAEVICNFEGDLEGGPKVAPTGTDATYGEDPIPDGMDYFEFITLSLAETNVEEYCNKSLAPQIPKDGGATVSSKRPRRGQARRGRQRKDFQRDILPGIVSLSKYDVIEDLQTIEELFKASGFTWQPRLSGRNAARKGRGRRRARASSPSPIQKTVCQPPADQPNCREVVLEETLPGWGKRTRRLPRQRCPTDNPAPALKSPVLAS